MLAQNTKRKEKLVGGEMREERWEMRDFDSRKFQIYAES